MFATVAGAPFFATSESYRIGIEACASGHYWARELRALGRPGGL